MRSATFSSENSFLAENFCKERRSLALVFFLAVLVLAVALTLAAFLLRFPTDGFFTIIHNIIHLFRKNSKSVQFRRNQLEFFKFFLNITLVARMLRIFD